MHDRLEEQLLKLELSDDWWSKRRAEALIRQVDSELSSYATTSLRSSIRRSQIATGVQAQDHQLRLIDLNLETDGIEVSFVRLPTQAIETIFAQTYSGPLSRLLATFGPDTAKAMTHQLVQGMALGYNPRKVARMMTRELGISRNRALLIAQTETLRAHRESSRMTYSNNRRVVKGWIWHSACDRRTCVCCWAMHGSFHELDETMAAHPACRCGMVPVTKTWKELGYSNIPETSFTTPSGSTLFAQLSAADQKAILGPTAYASYSEGKVGIEDFLGYRHSAQWGTSITRKPNKLVLSN